MNPTEIEMHKDNYSNYSPDCGCTFCLRYEKEVFHVVETLPLAPQVPLSGLVDEFGFEIPKGEKNPQPTLEDFKLIRGFLGNLKDQTLSRGVFKVLEALLERLPK